MTVYRNTAEGGSNGSVPTTGDTGSGDAPAFVTHGGVAGKIEYTNVQKAHGSLAYRFYTRGTSEAEWIAWQNSASPGSTYGRTYFRFDVTPTATTIFTMIRREDASTLLCYFSLSTARVFQMRHGDGSLYTGWTGPTLSVDTWYRLEYFVDPSTSGTVVDVAVKIYAADDSTVVTGGDSGTQSLTAAAADAAHVRYVRHGVVNPASNIPSSSGFFYFDDVVFGETTWPGAASQQYLRPDSDSVDGAWTNEIGSATNIYSSVDEALTPVDTDYIQSELAPASSAVRLRLSNATSPGAGSRSFRWRVGKDAASGATIDMEARVYQGGADVVGAGTLIDTFTRSAVSETATTYTETITGNITAAFPTASVIDNFGSAGGPPPPTNWTAWYSVGLSASGGQVVPSDAGDNGAYWTSSMGGAGVESFVTIATLGAATAQVGVVARLDPATGNGYWVTHEVGSPDVFLIQRLVGLVGTTIGGPYTQDLSAGDKIGIRCVGSLIQAWASVSGVWTLLGQVLDSTYAGTGSNVKIALYTANSTAIRLDDFGGGTSSGTHDDITDYTDLYVEFRANQV